jgi:caa(3)-type oxidase subunit IV
MADSHAAPAIDPADPHKVSPEYVHHIQKHVKGYYYVGALLFVFTVITVGLSYVDFGSHGMNILVGMVVATFKASLVAAIFMHLKGERATIWRFLIFTAIFALGLFLLTWLHEADPIQGTIRAIR